MNRLRCILWGSTPVFLVMITILLVVGLISGSTGLMTSSNRTISTKMPSVTVTTSRSPLNITVRPLSSTDRSTSWRTPFSFNANSVYGNSSLWENSTKIHENLSKLFPPKIDGDTKQSRATPSLLSSLLGWTSSLQKLTSPLGSSTKSRWSWPLESQSSWPFNSSEGRLASLMANDKYGGGSSHYHGDHHPHHSHTHKPPHSYGAYIASPYGGYKPGYSYYPHEIPPPPYIGASNEEMYYDKHPYYPPPLPPLPPDGVLAPVHKPHAKVSVTADFVELKCCVYGDYLPYIRWVKLAGKNHQGHVLFTTIAEGSHILYDSYHFAVRSDGKSSRLIIRDPDPHIHYGTYQCQVMVAGEYNHIAKDDFVVGRFY